MAGDDTHDDTQRQGGDAARGLTRPARLVAFICVVFLIFASVIYLLWRDTTPSEEELREKANLVGKSELFIGVRSDIPKVSLQDPATRRFTGFDIDIAYMIAADLGFRAEEVVFLPIETEDRSKMQAWDGTRNRGVDLVIAAYSIKEDRVKDPNVRFSSPYLNTEQSVLTLAEHPKIQDLSDLAGKKVCTTSTATSAGPAGGAGALVRRRLEISECISGLRDGTFEAVTNDAAILAGFVADNPTIFQHHDIGLETTESWAVNVGQNEALLALVNLSLYRSQHDPDDRRWEEAYERHLRPLEPSSGRQPVAKDRQPNAEEVEVRQWPWERLPATMLITGRPHTRPRLRSRRAASSGP